MVEDCQIRAENSNSLDESTFGLVLVLGGGHFQHLATYTEAERDSWMAALKSASHGHMRSHLEDLKSRLRAKIEGPGVVNNANNANANANANEEEQAFYPTVIGKVYFE